MANFDPFQAGAVAVEDKPQFDPFQSGAVPVDQQISEQPKPKMGLGEMLFDPQTAQNLRGGIQDIVYSLPGVVAQLPKIAYQGVKFFAGGPQGREQVIPEVLTEAVAQGQQMAKDIQAPLGSRESFRGLGNLAIMAAPALGEALGEAALLGKTKPPIQREALPQIPETTSSDIVKQQPKTIGGEINAEQVIGPTQVHGDVLNVVRPEESAGQVPANVGSEGVPTRGQGEIVQQTPQEVVQTVPQPEPFPSLLQSAEDQRRIEQPTPVSEPTEVATAQPLTKTEAVVETLPKGQAEPPPEVPPEIPTPSAPGAMTGLSKDFISADRSERGEAPLAQQARIGNEETWDAAGQKFANNPNIGHELVQSLTENPRTLNADDAGILLRHRVNLTNETEFNAELSTNPETVAPVKAEALQKLAALQDARNQADTVTRESGSQMGRSFQFLQQLAAQDYSLSSLIQQRRAAMTGKPIPPERLESFTKQTKEYSDSILEADKAWQNYLKEGTREESALKGYKTRLRGATTEYERRLAFSDFEPAIRREMQLDPEAIQLKANLEKAKDKFQRQLYKDTQENKPLWQKILEGASYAARESALSGISTLGKLASFTGAKLGEIPLTETAERVWGTIPGFRQIAKTSEFGPGANARQLGEFYKEFATTGMKEAWGMLKGEGSPTRQALEKETRFGFPSFFGNLHGVEKTPLLIGSQRMNRLKLMQNEMSKLSSEAIARGEDISDPLTQGAINYKSFQKATYDILQEQNGFANWVNRGLEQMEAKKKATGEVNATQAVLANLAKIFLTKGIIRVPANYFKQTLERTPLGLARGVGGAARAWYKGVENVSPAERTAIMKLMGIGSVGSGFFLWGALDALKDPNKRTFGGYYQPREDREKTGDVHFGAIRIGKEIPHLFTHNPMTESAQMGSTLMRVATSLISKKDQNNRGLIEGAIKSVFGLAEQAPISGQAFRLSKIGEPGGPTSVVGEALRGLIPQLVQNFAQWTDQGVKRKPTTTLESVKMGIPGLRQTVPEKKTKSKSSGTSTYGY